MLPVGTVAQVACRRPPAWKPSGSRWRRNCWAIHKRHHKNKLPVHERAMSDPSPGQATASPTMVSRGYAIVLLLVTVFIVYGSLFPFEYRPRTAPRGALA